MLFPAVLMNFPNSKVCLIGEWSIPCDRDKLHMHSNDISHNMIPQSITVKDILKNYFSSIVGVDALMARKTSKLELLKPFRILLNLLDKPEIGSAILEDVLVEVFKNLFLSYKHFHPKETSENKNAVERSLKRNEPVKQTTSKENPMEELIKTGNLLFNTFEPYFMWQYIAKLLASCNRRGQNAGDNVPTEGNDPGRNVSKENGPMCNAPTGEDDHQGESLNDGGDDENDEKLEILDVIRLTDFILNIVALVRF